MAWWWWIRCIAHRHPPSSLLRSAARWGGRLHDRCPETLPVAGRTRDYLNDQHEYWGPAVSAPRRQTPVPNLIRSGAAAGRSEQEARPREWRSPMCGDGGSYDSTSRASPFREHTVDRCIQVCKGWRLRLAGLPTQLSSHCTMHPHHTHAHIKIRCTMLLSTSRYI